MVLCCSIQVPVSLCFGLLPKMLPEGLNHAKVSEHILQNIGNMTNREELCDTRVRVKDQVFHCHLLILAAISSFFENFYKKNSDKNSWDITVNDEDVSPESFGVFLEYIYQRENPPPHPKPLDIFKCFAFLRIDFFTKDFDKICVKWFKPKDWVHVWLAAQKYKLINVVEKSSMMAAEHIDQIPEKTFVALHKSMLMILLSLQKKLTNDDIFNKIIFWVMQDKAGRLRFLNQLLQLISFDQLDANFLISLIRNCDKEITNIFFGEYKDPVLCALEQRCTNNPAPALVLVLTESVSFTSAPPLKAFNGQQYNLSPAPEMIGHGFATCKYKNGICLSGGTLKTLNLIYDAGENQWYRHSDLPGEGKEQHAKFAIGDKIFVLGGQTQTSRGYETSSEVLLYDIRGQEKLWRKVCHLPEAVRKTSAAALGHRIYVFGGLNAQGVKTDLVQCVDTVNNVAYVAGRLPFKRRSRALSNNGFIFVIRRSGAVLRMWEDFHLADQREEYFAATNERKRAEACEEEFTVSFTTIANFSGGGRFGACITQREIVVVVDKGESCDMNTIDISTGQVQKCSKAFNNANDFDLYMINIPKNHLQIKAEPLVIANSSRRSSETESLNSLQEKVSQMSDAESLTSEWKTTKDRVRGIPDQQKTGSPVMVAPCQNEMLNPKQLDTLQTSFVKPIATVTPESKVTDEIPRGRDDQQNIEIFKLLQTVTNQNQTRECDSSPDSPTKGDFKGRQTLV